MPIVMFGNTPVHFPEPRLPRPKRLPVIYLPDGGHGDIVGAALGCQCRECSAYETREILTDGSWDE